MLAEQITDKDTSIRRNSGLVVGLRKQMLDSEKQLLLLLKSFKEKKLSEDKYLEIVRSKGDHWISQLTVNEAKNLLMVIAQVRA